MKNITAEKLHVSGAIGSNIGGAIQDCIAMAKEYNCIVVLKFNDKQLQISKFDNVNAKYDEFFND